MMQARAYIVSLFLLILSVSCALFSQPNSSLQDTSADQPDAAPIESESTEVPQTGEPPTVSAEPTPIAVAELDIVGDVEIVFDWTSDRCEAENVPDLAARAFRDDAEQVHLIISHYINYQMVGPDLNSLSPDCRSLMGSDYVVDPGVYNDSEWIASPYTEDGRTVYALVHNEWRGLGRFGPCPNLPMENCLDTSITLAVSTDSGRTYTHSAEPPAHLVATLPHQAQAGAGPFGIRNPSNIIKGKDGFYYSFANVDEYQTQDQWVCLMRTDNLADAQSWRFWDGSAFEGRFINPYAEIPATPAVHECAPLEWPDIGASLNDSITYNTFLNRYVLIGNSADQIGGREVWGWYYAFSDDLINWSHRKLLAEVPLPWTIGDHTQVSYLYPSLIDPDSESRNFDMAGQTAYLYYTRHNAGQGSLDRDLVRVAVEFSLRELD